LVQTRTTSIPSMYHPERTNQQSLGAGICWRCCGFSMDQEETAKPEYLAAASHLPNNLDESQAVIRTLENDGRFDLFMSLAI